ncbi:DUF397 domain-containing protein [Streptomyces sp. BBFR2]|uniref:DUF397 domain-containing protein n=1 Tax=Streptomyces sp. BBFR2 TaxID=3372854 RepID=UPI0037DA6502
MNSNSTESLTWYKSSYSSQDGGNCLEWSPTSAMATNTVLVRDSKSADGTVLTPSARSWESFVSAIKAGQLEEL